MTKLTIPTNSREAIQSAAEKKSNKYLMNKVCQCTSINDQTDTSRLIGRYSDVTQTMVINDILNHFGNILPTGQGNKSQQGPWRWKYTSETTTAGLPHTVSRTTNCTSMSKEKTVM